MPSSLLIKIITGILVLSSLASGVFYFHHIIKKTINQKRDLEILQTNYEKLQEKQEKEHLALLERDKEYQEARKAHETQIAGLAAELNKVRANEKCIDTLIPNDVVDELRDPSDTN